VTIDVGAHVGYFSLLAGLANPEGTVYAFEPLAPVHARLQRNVALNELANVHCETVALGRRAGTAEFFHVPDSIPSSSSFSREFMESIVAKERLVARPVAVTTLDEFLAERAVTGVDLVKIDTESTENDVLAGMLETLRRDRPAIVCEVLPGGPAEEIEELLRPFGYRFDLLTDRGPVPSEHVEPHSSWRNFLFRPPAADVSP
jgi:FkbM family methyltransferase